MEIVLLVSLIMNIYLVSEIKECKSDIPKPGEELVVFPEHVCCLLYTSPSPRD